MSHSGIIKVQDGNGHWEVRYNAPRGFRHNKNFDSVTTRGTVEGKRWFDCDTDTWKFLEDCEGNCSTHHDRFNGSPKSMKAFLRYLKKHKELQGFEVILVNRMYYKFDDGTIYNTDIVAHYVKDE